MAVSNLLRLTLSGSGAGEQFAWGFHVKLAAALADEAQLAHILDVWNTNLTTGTTPSDWSNICGVISEDQHYDTLSGYYYSSAPGSADFLSHKSVSKVGSSPSFQILQCAAVVTLHTARTGASYRGRFFVPYTGQFPGAGHLMANSSRDAVALIGMGTMAAALDAIRAESGLDASRIHVYSPTRGTSNQVTHASVDNRFDVQRRRANKQTAQRTDYGAVQPA